MSFAVIPSADVTQGAVIDEDLMKAKIKNDLDDLNARTLVLEALSGGGSVAATAAKDLFATIIAGGEDNVAKFWKIRHHLMMGTTGEGSNVEGADFDQTEHFSRFFADPKFTIISQFTLDANQYQTIGYFLAQNEQVQFKIKKGENFFSIGYFLNTDKASIVSVFVDGVNANTFGLKDENDNAIPSSFSSNGTLSYGKTLHFFGLDGEEHIITVKNLNATAQFFPFQYIDVGFRPQFIAIDHTLNLKAGVADVGGIGASFAEGNYSFTKPTEGLANGYTGMLKVSQSGTVTAVDGISPASTQTRPNVNLVFSGAVTSLPVKNHYHFPTKGIALLQLPYGESYYFAWNGKGQTGGPQTQSLDNVTWERQPTEDFKPLVPSAAAAYVLGEWKGDARIEYMAKAPIEINGTNNKVDFQITINGVTTTHAATIASGLYSSDIMRIGDFIVRAMKTAKPLTNGEYFWEYDDSSQLWSYGVRGLEQTEIQFLWSTGANTATSFKTVIGETNDRTGFTSYISTVIKQHLAQRVFVADRNVRSSEHPSIKYNFSLVTNVTIPEADSLVLTSALPSYRRQLVSTGVIWEIFPDDDCCGMTLSFMREDVGAYVSYTVDQRDRTFLGIPGRAGDSTNPTKGTLIHYFISFPKGSRKITIRPESGIRFSLENVATYCTFFGYRQWFTKPLWETLAPQEKILKTVEVAPIRLFGTLYAHTAALYVPQVANDNINTLAETGTWAQTTNGTMFNQRSRRTSTTGSYIEVDFTLVGDGGGIGFMCGEFSTASQQVPCYLSNAAIVEANDQIELVNLTFPVNCMDDIAVCHLGLKAGTYKFRMKNLNVGGIIDQVAVFVVDTVGPQPLAETHTALANTGQGLAFPLNVKRRNVQRYGADRQPQNFAEGQYKQGIVNMTDYTTNAHNVETQEDNSLLLSQDNAMFFSLQWNTQNTSYFQSQMYCRSLAVWRSHFNTFAATVTPSVDGVNAAANITQLECVKGGLSPSATRYAAVRDYVKNMEYPAAFSSGLTFTMADTKGLRTNAKILLTDGTNFEEAFIASFIFNTSFTIKKALTVVSAAAVTKVLFWGYHVCRLTSGVAVRHQISAFEFEPLPLDWSILQSRVQTDTKEEIREVNTIVAVPLYVANTTQAASFEYPIHSDGEQANPLESHIEYLRPQYVPADGSGNSCGLQRGQKAWVCVNSNTTSRAAWSLYLNIKSRRQIAVLSSPLVRG